MDIQMSLVIINVLILAVLLGIGALLVLKKRAMQSGVSKAKKAAEDILEDAREESEKIKKEALLQAKEKLYQERQEFERTRQELEDEARERRRESQAMERRLQQKEESLDKRTESIECRDSELSRREKALPLEEKKIEELKRNLDAAIAERRRKLEGLSGMSTEDAKKLLIEAMEEEARLEAGKILKRIEEETKEVAERKAKEIMALAIQRYAGEYVSEKTVSLVNLPNDEMKGRIIGREGRNIRAIEAITGVDIIIDDTPEAVIISGHNPIRREVAKLTLERLVSDGRIHPARIEEIAQKVEAEVDKTIQDAGERAVFDTGIHGIHPDIQKLIGRLKFRTSYAQNVYSHSLEVAFICGVMASELGLPAKLARRAGLLHDIGKAVDHEVEGTHASIGAELAKKYGENQLIVDAIAEHHDDRPNSILAILTQAADGLSAARPGARKEMYETYVKRVEDLERIAKEFKGVEKSYALQAGREVRVIVESNVVDDSAAIMLARDISKKVEKELTYPGQVKITVIRETRAVEYAK